MEGEAERERKEGKHWVCCTKRSCTENWVQEKIQVKACDSPLGAVWPLCNEKLIEKDNTNLVATIPDVLE